MVMLTRRTALVASFAAATVAAAPAFAAAALAAPKRSRTMQVLDPNNNGTVDLEEARKAGAALFDRLDRNHNGVLNKRELGGRVTPQEFAVADPNKDGTLSKAEYLSVVEKRFKAADPDNDGTLDERELTSRAGRALLRLLLF
jgi:Ca2+-binding EF-hand superfamily protein